MRLSPALVTVFALVACSAPAGPQGVSTAAPTPTTVLTASPPVAATASPPPSIPGIVARIPTAGGPIGLAATADTIWVEDHRSNFVSRIDPLQNKEVKQLTNVNVHCDIAAGAGFVWATQASASTVNKIDPATGSVVASISLTDACGVAADATDVWVTSPGTGEAVRLDPRTMKERARVVLAPMVFWVAIGPEAVWVLGEADGGTVYRIDPAKNKLAASISAPNPAATGIAVGHGAVWVPARDNKVVYRIDPETNKVVATITMPSEIGGLSVGPDAIWSSGFGDGMVYRIDPASNQITGSISTGQGNLGPPLVAFGSVWVAALDQDVVVRIDPAFVHA